MVNKQELFDFKPGDQVRVPFGNCFIDAYVVKWMDSVVWVRGSDAFPDTEDIYAMYAPEALRHSDELKGPVPRRLPNAS